MKSAGGLLALMGVVALANAAEPPANYVAVHAGVSRLNDWPATVDFGGVTVDGRAKLGNDAHFGIMAGRETAHARFEIEYEHGRIKVDEIELAGQVEPADASGHYDAVMANVYRHDALTDRLRGFAGLGVGWGRVKLPLLRFSDGCDCLGPASRSGVAYQGRLGLAYQLAPEQDLSLQYTYLSLVGPRRGGTPSVDYRRRGFHAITLGYTYRF